MNLPAPPIFSAEDFPNVPPELLALVTTALRQQYDALALVPVSEIKSGTFISAASGVTTVSIKNPLPQKPKHIAVDVRRDDLADFSAAWSWWRVLSGEQIQLKFIGLPASTRLTYSVELR